MNLTEAFDALADRRVVMFGGKGGVGKTTISSFAALHYAKTRKVILFTTDPASNLGDVFDNRATRQPGNLKIESVDAQGLYAKFLNENLPNLLEIGDRGTYLDRDELQRFFELSVPGLDELMSWMRIGEIAEENEEAIVVVDTAPTGHTLRMLGAAGHFQQFAEALDTLEAKHRSLVRQFTRRNVRDAIDEYIERFEAQGKRRRDLLKTFVPVFLSEPWVVEQTLRLIEEVSTEGIDVPFVILNRAVLDPDCELDRERQKRDAEARGRFAKGVDSPRSCVPIAMSDRAGRAITAGGTPALLHLLPLGEGQLRLLFLAGKGGVGKTTCAASIALQLATAHPERKYTIISVDPAHALRDVFATEKPPANLSVEFVDTKEKWSRFRERVGDEIERAIGALTPGNLSVAYDSEALRKLIDIAPPGADELFAVSRLSELANDPSQALTIVDTAPTGHFLRLLELPATVGEWIREFMRTLLRYRELVPAGALGEELVSWSKAMHSIEDALHSDRSAAVVVTRPERIVIAETKRLLAALPMRCLAVIANYVTPENECRCDQTMRSYEMDALAELDRELLVVERREQPVTQLAGLAALFRVAAD